MSMPLRAIILLLSMLSVERAAIAQQLDRTQLRPVEPGTDDASPLSANLRNMNLSLASPSGFDQVYHVPGRDDLYMRVQGGVYAVFPRGLYGQSRGSTVAMVPANTVFFVGMPDAAWLDVHFPSSRARSGAGAGAESVRITTLVEEPEGVGSSPPRPLPLPEARLPKLLRHDTMITPAVLTPPRRTPHGRIVYDESYRRERIAALLRRAAAERTVASDL